MRVFSRTPLNQDSITLPKGMVYLIWERCKGCGLCVHFCPIQVLVLSQNTNPKGYHYPDIATGKDCNNCGFCTLICPEFAIFTLDANH